MPRLPQYTPQSRISGNLRRLPEVGGGEQQARALGGLADTTKKFTEVMARRRELEEIGRLNTQLSRVRVQTAKQLKQAAQGAQRGDDLVEPIRSSLDEEISKLSATVETAGGQQWLQKNGAAAKETYVISAMEAQARKAATWAREDVVSGVDTLSAELISNPNAFDSALRQFNDSLEVQVENGALSASEAQELRNKAGLALAESAVSGGIRENPARALAQLRNGEWDEYLDGKTKLRLMQQAAKGAQQSSAEARSRVQLYYEDTLASINETGIDPGLIDEETIADAYPEDPERVQVMVEKIENAKEFYGVRQEVALTSPEEDAAILDNLSENISGAHARQRTRQRDTYARAVQEKREALAEDPLGYVFSVSPELREKFRASADDPQAFRETLREANEIQADLGVPEWQRSFLGKRTAEQTVAQMNALPAEQAADQIESMAAQYGPMWPQVTRELREADLNPSYLTLARLDAPQDAVVRKELAAALQVGKKDLRQNVTPPVANMIDREVTDELAEFSDTLIYDGRAGQEILNAETSATRMLAYMYYQQGMAESAAAEKAANDLINNRYDFMGTYRAPKGKGGAADAATSSVMRELSPEELPPAPGGNPALSEDYRRRAQYQHALDGAWANTPQGDGVELLYPDGSPVILENGERVRVMFRDLVQYETGGMSEDFSSVRPGPGSVQ